MEVIIITIITLIAFCLMIALAIVKIVRGPKLPGGHTFKFTHNNNKAVVILDPAMEKFSEEKSNKDTWFYTKGFVFSAEELTRKCAIAMTAAEKSFMERGIKDANVNIAAFVFEENELFTKNAWSPQWAEKVAAYTIRLTGMLGIKKVYVAKIRSRYVGTTLESGQPAVHELIHMLNDKAGKGYNHYHDNKELWLGFGQDTVEGQSVKSWHDFVKDYEDNL